MLEVLIEIFPYQITRNYKFLYSQQLALQLFLYITNFLIIKTIQKTIDNNINDGQTGIQNYNISLQPPKELQYKSTTTIKSIEKDKAELLKLTDYIQELFDYLYRFADVPELQEVIKYIIADVEYCITDRKSGKQKKELTYQIYQQWLSSINNHHYDSFSKKTVYAEIDQQFQQHIKGKKDYVELCAEIHNGIKTAAKLVWSCISK